MKELNMNIKSGIKAYTCYPNGNVAEMFDFCRTMRKPVNVMDQEVPIQDLEQLKHDRFVDKICAIFAESKKGGLIEIQKPEDFDKCLIRKYYEKVDSDGFKFNVEVN